MAAEVSGVGDIMSIQQEKCTKDTGVHQISVGWRQSRRASDDGKLL